MLDLLFLQQYWLRLKYSDTLRAVDRSVIADVSKHITASFCSTLKMETCFEKSVAIWQTILRNMTYDMSLSLTRK
jgi:hypothetical protein